MITNVHNTTAARESSCGRIVAVSCAVLTLAAISFLQSPAELHRPTSMLTRHFPPLSRSLGRFQPPYSHPTKLIYQHKDTSHHPSTLITPYCSEKLNSTTLHMRVFATQTSAGLKPRFALHWGKKNCTHFISQ